jgi:hypothetical protein
MQANTSSRRSWIPGLRRNEKNPPYFPMTKGEIKVFIISFCVSMLSVERF